MRSRVCLQYLLVRGFINQPLAKGYTSAKLLFGVFKIGHELIFNGAPFHLAMTYGLKPHNHEHIVPVYLKLIDRSTTDSVGDDHVLGPLMMAAAVSKPSSNDVNSSSDPGEAIQKVSRAAASFAVTSVDLMPAR